MQITDAIVNSEELNCLIFGPNDDAKINNNNNNNKIILKKNE